MNSDQQSQLKNGVSALAAKHQAKEAKGRAVRLIGPAIPLAVALIGGALAKAPQTPQPPVATTSITATTAVSATNTSCSTASCAAPTPLLSKGHPVDWWFVFKLNSSVFPQCAGDAQRACPFGGTVQTSSNYKNFGQQFVYASSEATTLQDGGKECMGDTTGDPVGATFDEIYNGTFHYVVWNDQPYGDPSGECSGDSCGGPWAHSKGILAWNENGEGLVMQVSTPSWPLAGSAKHPRLTDGNTLGCIKDNNVVVSQHFFSLKLTKPDVVLVLQALGNSSVVTRPANIQVVNNGGPSDIQQLVGQLGVISKSQTVITGTLSSGVELISKPSKLYVPPWQMVSAELGGVPLRVANWWIDPDALPSTTADTPMGCWDKSLSKPGAVDIATTGHWEGKEFGLKGGDNPNGNHAKFAVSTSGSNHYVIFGDMNQEGSTGGADCSVSQNGRGGLFYVMNNTSLSQSVTQLLAGNSAPLPAKASN